MDRRAFFGVLAVFASAPFIPARKPTLIEIIRRRRKAMMEKFYQANEDYLWGSPSA